LTRKRSAALTRSRTCLAADFTNVLISIRRGRGGAKRQSPKASIDEVGFRGRQLASTLADQYSVLVIHVFLLSSIGSVERPKLFTGQWRKWLQIGATALAVEGIPIESAGCSQGACGQRPEPTGYDRDFLVIQITSALAKQYSFVVIHIFLLSSFFESVKPKASNKKFLAAKRGKNVAPQGATLFQQIGPHSPMDASPSLLGQTVVGTVQSVSVCSPPPTRSISSSFKERAPLRINTLFWSFMFCFLSLFCVC
jgi:hypothetical protein